MKKYAIALVSALALVALPAGAANAACPAVGSSDKSTTGGGPLPGVLEVDAGALSVYGAAPLLGYGESDLGTSGTNVTYSGEVAGTGAVVGHGEVEGVSVGTSGVSGSTDGQAAGLVSGSGHVSTTDGDVSAGGSPVGCVVNVGH